MTMEHFQKHAYSFKTYQDVRKDFFKNIEPTKMRCHEEFNPSACFP